VITLGQPQAQAQTIGKMYRLAQMIGLRNQQMKTLG